MGALFLPMMLLSGLDRHQRSAVMERLLPVILPFPDGQRVTFTALLAEQQVKRQVQTEHLMVKEAVDAAEFTEREDLKEFPTLLKTFDNLPPALQATVFPPAPAPAPAPPPPKGRDREDK